MITGTVLNTVKLQVLNNEWQQKKNKINEKKPASEMTQEERMLADFQEQMDRERESNSHADLYNKLKSGGKLTPEEEAYLEENDPEALRKYREDQAEKEAYERELKNCKTKDEVDRVKMNKLGNFAAQAKKISTDPYIPVEKKLELMNQLNDKLCRVHKAHMDFIDSQKYRDMPTERELAEEREEETAKRQEKTQEAVLESAEQSENDTDEERIIRYADNGELKELDGSANEEAAEKKSEEIKPAEKSDVYLLSEEDSDFEKLSDSIRRFVAVAKKNESRINITV